jgi:phosphate transport system protein
MAKKFDQGLEEIKDMIVRMGKAAEKMVERSMAALVDRKVEYVDEVMDIENKMDQHQKDIDELVVRMIATYTPVASNLRFLLMVTRINSELERIGDQAVNIAERARDLMNEAPLKPLVDLPRMSGIAIEMMHDSVACFSGNTDKEAVDIIKRDNEVDELNNQIFRELLTYMMSDPKDIPRALGLILVSRCVERIADHATNIAEEVVYLVRGQDIRHV